jgi:hypothetical protein
VIELKDEVGEGELVDDEAQEWMRIEEKKRNNRNTIKHGKEEGVSVELEWGEHRALLLFLPSTFFHSTLSFSQFTDKSQNMSNIKDSISENGLSTSLGLGIGGALLYILAKRPSSFSFVLQRNLNASREKLLQLNVEPENYLKFNRPGYTA